MGEFPSPGDPSKYSLFVSRKSFIKLWSWGSPKPQNRSQSCFLISFVALAPFIKHSCYFLVFGFLYLIKWESFSYIVFYDSTIKSSIFAWWNVSQFISESIQVTNSIPMRSKENSPNSCFWILRGQWNLTFKNIFHLSFQILVY